LKYYGEKKLLVGRIRFANTNDKEGNKLEKNIYDVNTKTTHQLQDKNANTKIVPIYMSEKNLKILNKTFMH
jgi:hypothetical protein